VFQSQLAAEDGRFTVADVATAIADKLVRRHPHVFGDVKVRDAQEVVRNWGRIKAEERRRKGEDGDVFAGVPAALPALLRAQQLGEKAAHVGLDWQETNGVLEKLREEQRELEAAVAAGDRAAIEHELGDLLLTVASLARHLDVTARSPFAARTTGSPSACDASSPQRGRAASKPRRSTPTRSTTSGRPRRREFDPSEHAW
jgi:MazG family protein